MLDAGPQVLDRNIDSWLTTLLCHITDNVRKGFMKKIILMILIVSANLCAMEKTKLEMARAGQALPIELHGLLQLKPAGGMMLFYKIIHLHHCKTESTHLWLLMAILAKCRLKSMRSSL